MSDRPSARPTRAPRLRTAAERRTRYTATSIVLVAAATLIGLFLIVLATRMPHQLDLTITRQHSLSPRTLAIIERIDTPVEIIVSADLEELSPAALEAMVDLLNAFERRSERLSYQAISTRSPQAPQLLGQAVQRFAQSHESAIARHRAAVADAVQQVQTFDRSFEEIERGLDALAAVLDSRVQVAAALRDAAAQGRVHADEFKRLRETLASATSSTLLGVDLPQADAVRAALGPAMSVGGEWARDVVQAMRSIEQHVARGGELPDVGTLPQQIRAQADHVSTATAAIFDRLDRLDPLEPLMIARLLSSQQAVVLLSQRGAAAIDFNTLFATSQTATDRAAQHELLFRGEESIANALASVTDRAAPIVVLVHGENERMLDGNGRPSPAGAGLRNWCQRLALRRIDIVEWPVALQEGRPALAGLMAAGQRPVVYVVMEAPTRRGLDTSSPTRAMAERAARVGRLAQTLTRLVEEGANLMVSLEPSEMPSVGEADPIAEALQPLGVTARVGNVILTRISHPTSVVIDPCQRLRTTVAGHAISDALQGVLTLFHLAMPIELADPLPEGVRAWPLYRAEDPGETVWAESSWQGLRYANVDRPYELINAGLRPPKPGDRNDLDDGPWNIAVAIERRVPRTPASAVSGASRSDQRVLLVASPGWFADRITNAGMKVGGRSVAAFPGNTELFDAGLYWLVQRDELIAAGTRRAEIPRIASLTSGQLSAIRWGLIVGLPVLILLAGVAYRVIRG